MQLVALVCFIYSSKEKQLAHDADRYRNYEHSANEQGQLFDSCTHLLDFRCYLVALSVQQVGVKSDPEDHVVHRLTDAYRTAEAARQHAESHYPRALLREECKCEVPASQTKVQDSEHIEHSHRVGAVSSEFDHVVDTEYQAARVNDKPNCVDDIDCASLLVVKNGDCIHHDYIFL